MTCKLPVINLALSLAKNNTNSIHIIEENDPDKVELKIYEKDGYTKIKSSPFVALGAPRGILRAGMQGLSKSNNNKNSILELIFFNLPIIKLIRFLFTSFTGWEIVEIYGA